MSTLDLLHRSAIDARQEYHALVLAEAAGIAEERDPQSIRELLSIVGKSAADLEHDIDTARQRFNAAKDIERAEELRIEAAELAPKLPGLWAEYLRVAREATAAINKAKLAHDQVKQRVEAASSEANRLKHDASRTIDPLGRRAIETANSFQRRINETLSSVAHDRSKLTGHEVKHAKATIEELMPQIERLERRIRSGGPAVDREELTTARERFNEAEAIVNRIEALRPAVEAADQRVAELDIEKQAALDNPPAWDEFDFFAGTPDEEQRFGRPVTH